MKRTLLLSLLMALTLAARAVRVTFAAPEGFEIWSVIVDGDHLEGFYDEATQTLTYGADLEPGQHSLTAQLVPVEWDNSWGNGAFGGAQTFTVGDTPMTVTYGTDNFALLNLTVLDESGAPLEGAALHITDGNRFDISYPVTGAEGTAQAYIPADAGTFTYSVSAAEHDVVLYAPLSQTVTLQGKEMNLTLSYATCRRVTLSVPAFDFTSGNYLQFSLYGTGGEASANGVSLEQSVWDYMEEKEACFVVPQGTYSCRATERNGNDNSAVRVAQQQLTVSEEPVSASLDFSGGVMFTVNYSDITINTFVTLYLMPEDGTSQSEAFECTGPILLPQGKYRLYGDLYGDDGNTYSFNCPVELAADPVSLTLERDNFHRLQFTPSGLDADELPVAISHDMGDGSISANSGDNVYYWGDYTYAIQGAVWIDGWSYALPFGLGNGRISVGSADVNVTVDMSGLRAFKASLPEGMQSVNEVWFTRTDGAKARLAFVSSRMGVALPVGTYSVTATTDAGKAVACTLNVLADCPESLHFDFSGSSTGIYSASAQSLTACAANGSLRIAAPEGGMVSVSVYDLSGRRVIDTRAAAGDAVSIAALAPGIYVARLIQGQHSAAVKFMVR